MGTSNMIFLGVSGLFKKTAALKRAMELLNTDALGNHPDFLLIEPDEKEVIRVDEVARISEHVSFAPVSADRKVVVICRAHLATEEFQNSILKFLEDYTERCTFLLTAEKPLLDTIHSRCMVVPCGKWSTERMEEYVTKQGLPSEKEAFALAAGRPGVYCSLFNEQADLLKEAKTFAGQLNKIGSEPKSIFRMGTFSEDFYKTHTTEQISLLMGFIQGCFLQLLYYQMGADESACFDFVDRKAADNIPVDTVMPIVEKCIDDIATLARKGKYGKTEYFNFARYVYSKLAG